MSNEAQTFHMTLAGRQIEFRRATLGQVLLIERAYHQAAKRAQGESDDGTRMEIHSSALVKVLDFIESLIVSQDDRDFVEEKMLAGEVDFPELLAALGGGKGSTATADDEAPKKAIKRAASKKVAPAKSVASRGRTKR